MAVSSLSVVAGPSLMVVVLEASKALLRSAALDDPAQRLPMGRCLDDLTTFINSYLLMSQQNSVGVCLCHQAGSDFVYPAAGRAEGGVASQEEADSRLHSGKFEALVAVDAELSSGVKHVLAALEASPPRAVASSCVLAGGLSKALCYIHRRSRESAVGTSLTARILVLRSSPDEPSQYIPTMNCIFAAQKHSIPIDSCVLWRDSGFLQQASDITGGVYLKLPEAAGLLQFLLWVFLADAGARDHLSLPLPVQVDFRASCFCHQRLVEVGYVCSVCLAIFCQFTPICSICHTHFKRPSLAPLRSGKKKKSHNINSHH